mmetsp:Transcript_17911/g.36917  ORF Transcript_17911/g.36917 Transcript_17911/m.36917 type:complete len:420 (-) Transcript_17911:237-1496(-)
MDRSSSGDEDRASSRGHRDGNSERQFHRYNSRDYDARSQSSQRSQDHYGDPSHYNLSASSSVGSHGSGGSFPLHGHVHFRHATISATHLLNGDPAHQFPPSLYQSAADAPKSDTATVCSNSMLEDIEDVSHYDGDNNVAVNSKQPPQHHHNYPPPSSLRRTNSKEGNRLVDFAERSQAVFPKQSKTSSVSSSQESNPDETDAPVEKGMGPPLSRHWLLQHHGISPFRTGSVKSGGSTAGSDVVVNVGSDCGGSLTDVQSVLSQEDAALTENPENVASALDTSATQEDGKPHPLLCDPNVKNGRISPGGTIYRGRGVRRYKGRFYALPLKRFHQDGVHLHSDSEHEGSDKTSQQSGSHQQHDDGDHYQHDYQRRGEWYERDRGRDRSRSRSRSPPPAEDRKREARNRNVDTNRGYKIEKK